MGLLSYTIIIKTLMPPPVMAKMYLNIQSSLIKKPISIQNITYPISVKALMRPLLWSKPLFQAPKNLNKSYISTMRNL